MMLECHNFGIKILIGDTIENQQWEEKKNYEMISIAEIKVRTKYKTYNK